MNDRDTPFLRPLWRRVVLVGFCSAWALWEFWNGETFWAMLVGAITVYGAWTFLIDFDRKPPEKAESDADGEA